MTQFVLAARFPYCSLGAFQPNTYRNTANTSEHLYYPYYQCWAYGLHMSVCGRVRGRSNV
jgi:hypothetical protein